MARSFDDLAAAVVASWDDDTQAVHAAASEYYAAQLRSQLSLGKQLADLRAEHGMTQTELAQVTGVPQPEISRIERGTGNPTRETLVRLASALNARLVLLPDEDQAA